jgi:hypothetical protein
VKKFMDKNPETTIEQLMKTDFKTILRAYNWYGKSNKKNHDHKNW